MYSLLVLLVLATSVLYVMALERNSWGLWAAYVVATWVMLTSHSLSGLVLVAQVASTPFLVRSARGEPGRDVGRNRWVKWGWAMLLILAPVFPIVWLRLAALVTGTVESGNWYTDVGLGDILLTIFVKFATNQSAAWQLTRSLAISAEAVGAIAMGGLALAGAWVLVRGYVRPYDGTQIEGRRVRRPYVLVGLLWLVPVAVFWLVTLQLPLFHPRYLIMSLPAYLVLVAAGLVAAWRLNPILALVPLALLGLATGTAYASFNYAPDAQKEDWRGAMAYVQDHIRLRDTIVAFPGYLASAVDLYFTPGGPGLVPDRPIAPVPSLRVEGYGDRELEDDLRAISECSERVWLVVSPARMEQEDPEHRVLQWFQYNFHTFDTRVFNGVTVYGIAFNQVLDCWYPNPDWVEPHTFENGLEFLGYIYEWRDDDETPTQPDASYLPLTLYWRSEGFMEQDYDIRVQVVAPDGEVVKDESLGPLNGYFPTSQWPQHFQLMDYRDVRLPGGLEPGAYTVKVQVHPAGQPDMPLRLEDGSTEIVFGQPLQVVPWGP
jgi:multisubunit Na+/H+ antiporter MnhB subunit